MSPLPAISAKVAARFWSKVDRSGGSDACWPWIAGRFSNGYGAFRVGGRPHAAHRVALVLSGAELGGLAALHHCDNPPCCNPAHLFVGTLSDNARDMIAKGRGPSQNGHSPKGERHGSAKLTEPDVRRIREQLAAGEPRIVIAATFAVSPAAVWLIERGRTWRHVA
jgi:hypothetical protein